MGGAAEVTAAGPGPVLLRSFVAPVPHQLPECQVPLAWLAVLRDIPNCSDLAIDALLAGLEALEDENLEAVLPRVWQHVEWREANTNHVDRAVDVLIKTGAVQALAAAELGARDREQQRLHNARVVSETLAVLPLTRITNPGTLLAPELPAGAAALLADQRARLAEELARDAGKRARRAEEGLTGIRQELANVRQEAGDRTRRLETQVNQLQQELRVLRAVRAAEAPGARHD